MAERAKQVRQAKLSSPGGMLHSLYQKRNKETHLGFKKLPIVAAVDVTCIEAGTAMSQIPGLASSATLLIVSPDCTSPAAKPDIPKPSMTAADISEVIEPSGRVLPMLVGTIKHKSHA